VDDWLIPRSFILSLPLPLRGRSWEGSGRRLPFYQGTSLSMQPFLLGTGFGPSTPSSSSYAFPGGGTGPRPNSCLRFSGSWLLRALFLDFFPLLRDAEFGCLSCLFFFPGRTDQQRVSPSKDPEPIYLVSVSSRTFFLRFRARALCFLRWRRLLFPLP